MKLQPIGKNVIIHPIEDPTMSESGRLYLPEQSKQRTDNGIVVALGPQVTAEISVADHVIFSGYTGDQIAIEGGGKFFVIHERDLLGKLVPSETILIDTLTAIRVVKERLGEIRQKESHEADRALILSIEQSLIDRIESLTTAEGFMF